ncbi:inhibitor of nuclear factor kappa-B kinase subunit beta-like [Anneissia japonica]|uniref:inhibitor of nuclear factor kappa-B kinase subunit beta-like n=1 Tax=Anneissia japonica TaxID=1529436 RepID=UPI001425A20F|nr:inhibitor of nuclear factor kappa-B kinase subunit beta-like [Anneissia japonica]XP_033120384.1 inhibitor of nuclear factor kappa-B kinase subunit beta-like [Anneissia japonica]
MTQPMQVTTKVWELQKKLGSGGFGEVILYRNKETGEQIAFKRCKIDLDEKNLHRWQQEIDIMNKLNHENVVRARDVPEELLEPQGMPILGMEYCQDGDLRKVLNLPANVCGLDQSTVLTLAKHIASAVEYLHSKRVIHRDLKPENIVMQRNEEQKIIYKLIDLGYAKDMDQSSVARTFVGTLQYLAPELFTAKSYTNTADYWSLGVLLFESICGVRPFLPNIPPVQWHGTVGQKKENDICVYIDLSGNPVYSEHIHEPFQLSKCYQNMFEVFLRSLLQWDPSKRGGPTDANRRAQCFILLESILNTKLANVFCVNSQSVHSYPIDESSTCQSLKIALAKDTGIAIEDQDILFSTGKTLDMQASALQCWGGNDQSEMTVFLFHKTYLNTEPQQISIPERVEHILQNEDTLLPYGERKKAWGQGLFLITDMDRSFNKLLEGARAAEISMLSELNQLNRLNDYLKKMQGNLEGVLDFFRTSARHDIEMYQQQAVNGITSEKIHRSWLGSEKTVDQILRSSKPEELEQKMLLLNTKINEIRRSPIIRQQSVLTTYVVQTTNLYGQLKKKAKDDGHLFSDSVKLVNQLKPCLDMRKKLTKELLSHIQKILHIKQEIQDILREMQVFVKIIHENTIQIKGVQIQRQSDMWNLLRIVYQKLNRTSGDYQSLKRSLSTMSDPTNNISMSATSAETQDSLTLMNESDTTQSQFEQMFKSVLLEQEKSAAQAQSMDWSFVTKS